jgi:hypothetical protein
MKESKLALKQEIFNSTKINKKPKELVLDQNLDLS